MNTNVAIGILVGGRSHRMGRPKALLPVGHSTILEHSIEVALEVSHNVSLLGIPNFELPVSVQRHPILPDAKPDIGPLAGLHSLLLHAAGRDAILLACDMPYLSADLLHRLVAASSAELRTGDAQPSAQNVDAFICRTLHPASKWHPCCALYRTTCCTAVAAAIADRRLGLLQLFSSLTLRPIDLIDMDARCVENWNEPGDLPNHRNMHG